MNAEQALDNARGEIGYSRWSDPEAGSKYGRWYAKMSGEAWCGANGIPYCAMFDSWCLYGLMWDVLPSYNCDQIRQRAEEAGYVLDSVYDAQPGDLVLYDWNGDGSLDHVGIVEENNGGYITTIEGNTSSGSAGSQGNGGVVARRTRSWKYVACVVRPPYTEDDDSTSAQEQPAQQAQPTRRKAQHMEFITKPNEKDYLVYFDGTHAHKLMHEDEAEAVRMAYRECYDEELPSFEMGTAESPWFTRFMDAMNGAAPDDLGTLRE